MDKHLCIVCSEVSTDKESDGRLIPMFAIDGKKCKDVEKAIEKFGLEDTYYMSGDFTRQTVTYVLVPYVTEIPEDMFQEDRKRVNLEYKKLEDLKNYNVDQLKQEYDKVYYITMMPMEESKE